MEEKGKKRKNTKEWAPADCGGIKPEKILPPKEVNKRKGPKDATSLSPKERHG